MNIGWSNGIKAEKSEIFELKDYNMELWEEKNKKFKKFGNKYV